MAKKTVLINNKKIFFIWENCTISLPFIYTKLTYSEFIDTIFFANGQILFFDQKRKQKHMKFFI